MHVNDLAIRNIAEIISKREQMEKFTIFVNAKTFGLLSIANDPKISRMLEIRIDEKYKNRSSDNMVMLYMPVYESDSS